MHPAVGVQGVQAGFGTLHLATGEEYSGEVAAGAMHGRGRLRLRSGDVFHGAFDHGRRFGEGRLEFAASGDVFVGRFEGERRVGFGVHFYPASGCKLEGEWAGDTPVCGTMLPMSAEEAAALGVPAFTPEGRTSADERSCAAALLPPLRLAHPNKVLLASVAPLRPPAAARPGRELSAREMGALRHAFSRIAGGEAPGAGVSAGEEGLGRALRESGVAASLAEPCVNEGPHRPGTPCCAALFRCAAGSPFLRLPCCRRARGTSQEGIAATLPLALL